MSRIASRGLDLGADDYLGQALLGHRIAGARARCSAPRPDLLSSRARRASSPTIICKIDFARAEVWRGEEPVSLSATEYRLLLQFAHNIGKILTSEELLTSVWGPEYKTDKEILWVSIARLRQKLEDDAHNPKHIVTRSGLGYLMPPSKPDPGTPSMAAKIVLIIDPDAATRTFLSSHLRQQHYSVLRWLPPRKA